MQTVPYETILETWNELDGWDEAKSTAMAQQFMSEQPAIGAYLLAQTESLGEEAEPSDPADSYAFDLTIAIWQAFTKAANRALKAVPPYTIEQAEEKNLAMLEQLGQDQESEEAGAGLMGNYNQRELLGFALEVIMSPYAENPDLAPENIGLELVTVKTVIDCLDQ